MRYISITIPSILPILHVPYFKFMSFPPKKRNNNNNNKPTTKKFILSQLMASFFNRSSYINGFLYLNVYCCVRACVLVCAWECVLVFRCVCYVWVHECVLLFRCVVCECVRVWVQMLCVGAWQHEHVCVLIDLKREKKLRSCWSKKNSLLAKKRTHFKEWLKMNFLFQKWITLGVSTCFKLSYWCPGVHSEKGNLWCTWQGRIILAGYFWR